MRKRNIRLSQCVFLLAVLFLTSALPVCADTIATAGQKMPVFKLKDTQDGELSSEAVSGKVFIAIFAVQGTDELVQGWQKSIETKYVGNAAVAVKTIVNLKGLPAFITEDLAKMTLKGKFTIPVLMDMGGKISDQFGVPEEACIVLVGKDSLIKSLHKDLNDDCYAAIGKLLK